MTFLDDGMILLRAVEPEDAESMWEFETDSRHWYDNGMLAPFSRHNLKEYAVNYDADPIRCGQLRLIIEKEKEIAGIVDLYDIMPSNRTAFIGLYVKEGLRKKHIATRALKLTESYSRQLLNLRILAAKISGSNKASISLFEKNGYSLQGVLKDWFMSGKEFSDLKIFIKDLTRK